MRHILTACFARIASLKARGPGKALGPGAALDREPSGSRARAARGGFTLIESLVAFVILTLAMGALMQGLGGGARNEARGDFLLRAARQGRSQIEALGVATPLAAGESSGRYADGLVWRLIVSPYRSVAATDGNGRTTAYFARLTVRRPGGAQAGRDSLTLTAIKLAIAKPRQ
ncbi:prepilin-type N-terminal cleavage/methylation domain-containing protein [Methylosinus sp. Sm6]|uniref:type IV pilus modification PilV family protein n=1 Tax=Methylosinus sp. Sm6 TaxID=2866948 RepID=UPI001C99187C|nr:type II secretion system protein [Methylosinus sp. Sm6]MBY6242698.1 type II secretion system GspH family protein [Methylosinus sp. Sm6]